MANSDMNALIEEAREHFLDKFGSDPRLMSMVRREASERFDIPEDEDYLTSAQEEAICVLQLLYYDKILKALF